MLSICFDLDVYLCLFPYLWGLLLEYMNRTPEAGEICFPFICFWFIISSFPIYLVLYVYLFLFVVYIEIKAKALKTRLNNINSSIAQDLLVTSADMWELSSLSLSPFPSSR
jgi:hypothetical protein